MIILYLSQFSSKWHALGCIKIRKKISFRWSIYTMVNRCQYAKYRLWTLITDTLAYVEWYTKPKTSAEPHNNMYQIAKAPLCSDNTVKGSILPLANIWQTCQLFPKFGLELPSDWTSDWTSDNVLDKCPTFLINNWGGLYAYQTIW